MGIGLLGAAAQKYCLKKWTIVISMGAVIGLAAFFLAYFSITKIYLLLFLPLAAIAVHYLLFLPWSCAGLAATLSCVIWMIQQLIWSLFIDKGIALAVPFFFLALMGIIYALKKGILPENYSQFLSVDDSKCHRLSLYLWAISGIFLLITGWMAYLLSRQFTFQLTDRLILFITSIFFFAVLLFFIRGNAHYFVDQIEVLVDKQYQAELQNFMQVIRSQRHDFNFHLQAISAMLEEKQYNECRNYINTMVQSTNRTNDVLLLHFPAVSAMLSTFQEITLQKGIDFEIIVHNDLKNIPCTVYELNTIIGNLIQNAIDEVELYPKDESWIKVFLLKRGGNNVVRVANPFHGTPESLKHALEVGYSTKSGNHEGIGLSSVQHILSRHDGLIFPEYQDGTISFIAQFPIHYQHIE